MLTLITATGMRPAAFRLCERWMRAQAYNGSVHWIIVDDGPTATRVRFARPGWTVEYVRPVALWTPGENTQAANLREAIRRVPRGSAVAIIEDDDYYPPDYLATVDARLREGGRLVGEARARYYNVEHRWFRQLTNQFHASLCATAMQPDMLRIFDSVCAHAPRYIDLELWRRAPAQIRRVFPKSVVVGIKGMPGRPGIGGGHDDSFNGTPDPDGAVLREWLGRDAEAYL